MEKILIVEDDETIAGAMEKELGLLFSCVDPIARATA